MNKENLNGYFDKATLSEEKKTEIKNALRQKFPQYADVKTQTDRSDEIIKNKETLSGSAKVKPRRFASGAAIAAAAAVMITAGGAYLYKTGQEDIPSPSATRDVDIDSVNYYNQQANELYTASSTTLAELETQGYTVTAGTADTGTYNEAAAMDIDAEMYRISRSNMNDFPLVGFMLRLIEIINENNYDVDLGEYDFEIVIGENNTLKYVSVHFGSETYTYPAADAIDEMNEMQDKADYLAKCLYISGLSGDISILADDHIKYDNNGLVEISYSKGSYNSPISEDNQTTTAEYVDILYTGDSEKRNKVYQDFYVQDKGTDPKLIMLEVLSSFKSFVSEEDFELLINSDVTLHYGGNKADFYVEITLDNGTYSIWNTEKTNQQTANQLYEAASECYNLLNDKGINIQYDNVTNESIMKAADIMQENNLSSYGEVYEFCLAQTDGFSVSDAGFAAYLNQYLADNGYTVNLIDNGYTINLENFEQFTIVFDYIEEMNADFAAGVKMAYVNNNGFEAYYPTDIDLGNPKESNNDLSDENYSDEEKLYNSALLFCIDLTEKGYTVDTADITKETLTKALLSSVNYNELPETNKTVSSEQFAYLLYKGCLENSFEGGKLYGKLDLTTLDDFTIEFGEVESGHHIVSRVTLVVEGDMVYEYPISNN
ncbi:MAG: hypothetical protein Q4E74_08110 [Ruminococcus sp.]|nr:hypothetical protein [Ruminococcus sp.]